MKGEYIMHRLISALIVYHHNIKMLHWTCTGKEFDATHEYLDDMAKQLYEYTDVIAEIMMSKDKIIPTLSYKVQCFINCAPNQCEHLQDIN